LAGAASPTQMEQILQEILWIHRGRDLSKQRATGRAINQ
jgi:hypothetical protein